MGYIEQENCVRLCNDLARMLEEEKNSPVRLFIRGYRGGI